MSMEKDILEIKADVKEIKTDIKALTQLTAVHNQILQEHKGYSQALQNEQRVINAKIEPLIKDHYLISIVLKIAGAVLVGVAIQLAVRYAMHI